MSWDTAEAINDLWRIHILPNFQHIQSEQSRLHETLEEILKRLSTVEDKLEEKTYVHKQ